MSKIILSIAVFSFLISSIPTADARGGGKFLSSFLSSGAARAATRGTTGAIGPKTYGFDMLTVSQLAECLKRASAMDAAHDRNDEARNNLKALIDRVDALKARIDDERITLDRHSQRAVDNFNALVRQYNALGAQYKAEERSFNSQIADHNAQIDSYNLSCAKKYYESDLAQAKVLAGIE